MPTTFENMVNGEWVPSETGETFPSVNPANTDDTVGRFQDSSQMDAEVAIYAANRAAEEWSSRPGPERGHLLRATGDILADRKVDLTKALVREEGKVRNEAAGEVQRAIDIFHYYASKARDIGGDVRAASSANSTLYTVREPIGVAGVITPWNYPIAIPAWKIAPALAAGNTIVFNPASLAAGIGGLLTECLVDAGFPDGVINLVTGSGKVVGGELTTNENVDAISFTGSESVGDVVYQAAAEDQKRVQLEMGGKNPAVVMPSVNIDEAAEIVGSGSFGVTGQACTATSRAIVHEEIYEEFVSALVEHAEAIDVGPGLEGGEMGPQVNEDELQGTLDLIDSGEEQGARLLTGGGHPSTFEKGYFVEPTVFTGVNPDMRIAQEEIFGPVVAVISVSDFDEALEVTNGVRHGLSASIITQNLTEANRFIDEAEAGVVKVNEQTTGLELHVPFGGVKASSSETFREQGDAGLDFYSITKTVYMNY